MIRIAAILCSTLALATACKEDAPKPKPQAPTASVKEATPAPSVDDTPKPSELAARAEPMIAAFQEALKSALMLAMKEGGPTAAINVCSEKAPQIADKASAGGLRIRRIGTRTRNPLNKPSPQDERALQHLSKETPMFEEEDVYYKAIFLQPLCVTCHGSKEQLAPEVSAALERKYPNDKALGYAPGDLRGAFVVEPLKEAD